jgi:hypothetical protein
MMIAILGLVGLLALAVLAGILAKIHAALVRLLNFLDAQDIDRRRSRADDLRAREVRAKAAESFFRDTRGILGKLHTIAEEQSPHHRETMEMGAPFKMPALAPASTGAHPAPTPETTRKPDATPASRERRTVRAPEPMISAPETNGDRDSAELMTRILVAPTAAQLAGTGSSPPTSEPAQRAAGLSRPKSPQTAAPPPPVRVDAARPLPTVVPPPLTKPRFPATLLSMDAVKAPQGVGKE